MKIPGHDKPGANILQLVSNWLSEESNGRWLMIVDNADDVDLLCGSSNKDLKARGSDSRMELIDYMPNSTRGSFVYITRSKVNALRLTGHGKTILVNKMSAEDSKALLRSKLAEKTSDEGGKIYLRN